MNTPLDLDAIRRRINHPLNHPLNDLMVLGEAAQADRQWNVAAIAALIAEVEALRKELDFTKQIAIEANLNTEAVEKLNADLCAKLEKAKQALGIYAYENTSAAKALAELEKP